MDSRISYIIKNIEYDGYLNRMADGLVTNLFKAIWFASREEAELWMQGGFAPKDTEHWNIVETVTFIAEVEEDGK